MNPDRIRRGLKRRINRLHGIITWPAKIAYAKGLLSTQKMCLPDFLIIGAQKAGTTWLHHNLNHHPDIFFPHLEHRSDPTEVRYFDQKFHNSLRFYADLYQPACNLIKGDKSPNYYMLPQEQIRFIYNIMPDVKIIFMLRNPIDRAWSHAMMNLVKLPQRSFESVSREAFLNHFVRTQPKGDYFTALNNWRAIFPTENIMVGFYEQIRQAPFKLLEATFTHIGAPLNVNWDSFSVAQKINRGPGQSMDPFYRATLTEMFTDEIKALETEFGAQVSHWLQQ